MIYLDIFEKLNKEGVDYLVVGGVALVLHGHVRFTGDLDLMILPQPQNLQKLVSALSELGYKPKLPMLPKDINFNLLKEWKENKNLQVLAFYDSKDPLQLVDVLIDPVVDYKKAYKEKKIVNLKEVKIPIISINDLIKLKEEAGRPKDLEDIASLSKIKDIEKENGK